ncbi:TPA: hypothetical protein ACOFD8_001370 [Stenotrophomonas maltophilia]|jgi:hypothetical protein
MDKLLLATMVALLLASCSTVGGDIIIRISGTVPASSVIAERQDTCQLQMVSIETGEHLNTREVGGEFSLTMMVVSGPAPTHYFFIADCSDGRRLNSRKISISSRRSQSRTFNLGTLSEGDL